ncbi:MAG TPA: hypothetical protein DDW18_04940 [Firmicutes bacterium]|nr:hypothetical protein [Bacillota bacterium]HBN00782.1 hypothetical protein [Bacillota bacterium]
METSRESKLEAKKLMFFNCFWRMMREISAYLSKLLTPILMPMEEP